MPLSDWLTFLNCRLASPEKASRNENLRSVRKPLIMNMAEEIWETVPVAASWNHQSVDLIDAVVHGKTTAWPTVRWIYVMFSLSPLLLASTIKTEVNWFNLTMKSYDDTRFSRHEEKLDHCLLSCFYNNSIFFRVPYTLPYGTTSYTQICISHISLLHIPFAWCAAPDPAGGAYSAPRIL